MLQNSNRADLVFRVEVAQGHLTAIRGMLQGKEPLEKVLHQICAVQAALGKITMRVQKQLLEQSISAIRANPMVQINDNEVNKLISLYTSFTRHN